MAGLLKLSESDLSPRSWLSRGPKRNGMSQGAGHPEPVTCRSMIGIPTPVLCCRNDDPATWGRGVPFRFLPQEDWKEQKKREHVKKEIKGRLRAGEVVPRLYPRATLLCLQEQGEELKGPQPQGAKGAHPAPALGHLGTSQTY